MNRYSVANKIRMLFVVALSLAVLVFSNETLVFATAPSVATLPASSITTNAATLGGFITNGGKKNVSAVGFEYGTTTSYGSTFSQAPDDYDFDFDFDFGSTGTGDNQFNSVMGVAVGASGRIYVADGSNHRVQTFDSSGVFINTFGFGVATGANQFEICTSACQAGLSGSGNGEFGGQMYVELDTSENIYIIDTNNNRIQKFDSNGNFQWAFGTFGTGNLQFKGPTDIAFDSSGNIYVADTNNNRIQKFDSTRAYLATLATSGSGNGQVSGPSSLEFDSSGNLVILDAGNARVEKITSSGVFVSTFGVSAFAPLMLAIDGKDDIYVTDFVLGDSVLRYASDGTPKTAVGSGGSISTPFQIDFDNDGNLYVANSGMMTVTKFRQIFSSPTLTYSLTSLSCATDYHYRFFATNADGTTYGADELFTTSACEPPIIATQPATVISKTSAFLNGIETDDGVATSTARGFEYGTSTQYGHTVNLSDTSLSIFKMLGSTGSSGVAVDSTGRVYQTDINNNRLVVMNETGAILRTFGFGVTTGANQFEICTSSGCFSNGGLPGSGDGQFDFSNPSTLGSIALDGATGNVFVEDNNGLQKFDSSGNFIERIPNVIDARDMLIVSGNPSYLYINGIKKYTLDGTLVATLTGGDTGLAKTSDGVIFSVDNATNRILYTSPSSGSTGVVTFTYPSGISPINNPFGIAFDSKNNMIISDSGSAISRIVFATPETPTSYAVVSEMDSQQIFDAAAVELTTVASDVAVSNTNRVYIASVNDGLISLSPFMSYKVKPLDCATTYHYRAFATNPEGTGYGNDVSFTTLACGGSSGGGGGPPPPPVYGCTDPAALNYSALATSDDGSCTYPPGYFGCTDPAADNYDAGASVDDGSCSYGGVIYGCTDATATNYNALATSDDGSCTHGGGGGPSFVFGCTDAVALNYNALATSDDGSCAYGGGEGTNPILGCMDSRATNFDPLATQDNGLCVFAVSVPPWVPTIITSTIGHISEYVGSHPPVHQALQILAVTGVVVPGSLYIFNEWLGIASLILRLWNLIPTIFGLRRKRRPWGTVYDSVTKQPLDPVTVVLSDMMGAEISTSITDLDGRYGFWVPQGTYKIVTNKGDYIFPSAKMAGKDHDELYDNLYFGAEIVVKSEDDIINKNIPMDAINFNWNEFEKTKNKKLMKFYSARDLFLARIAKILFAAGFISSIVLSLIEPRLLNYVVLGIYILILVLALFGIKPKSAGHVLERATKMPLSFGIMKVFSAGLGTEVNHTVIGATGKYYLLVPKGRYYIKIMKKTGEDSYEELFTSKPFTARHGYISKVIKV